MINSIFWHKFSLNKGFPSSQFSEDELLLIDDEKYDNFDVMTTETDSVIYAGFFNILLENGFGILPEDDTNSYIISQ